jgi:hypothetical protein
MGYIKAHTIVVTGGKTSVKKAHKVAKEIFNKAFFKDNPYRKLVSSIVDSKMNETFSFFIAPDGSKEGWETSDIGDEARASLLKELKKIAKDTGLDYVELFFGEDNGKAKILNHN